VIRGLADFRRASKRAFVPGKELGEWLAAEQHFGGLINAATANEWVSKKAVEGYAAVATIKSGPAGVVSTGQRFSAHLFITLAIFAEKVCPRYMQNGCSTL
jgi:hypothetical protein